MTALNQQNHFTMAWIPPIFAYCSASICMTLTNKLVLSGYQYKMPFLMLGIQSISSVLLLQIFTFFGMAKHRGFNRADAYRWFPVALLMATMLYTGSKSLQFLTVPVFTIFKNLSIILVAYSESKVFGNKVTPLMLLSFGLMVLSSIIAAQSDYYSKSDKKGSSFWGYIWMLLNCFSSAAFVVFMRYTMKSPQMTLAKPFKDFDTVFYNNFLTAPMFIVMSLMGADGNLFEAIKYYGHEDNIGERNSYVFALLFSGISAFWISYASSWCMRITNSTTYSMVGSLNKLPIAISGLLFFKDTEITVGSVGSILLGFLSGIIYTLAKLRLDDSQKRAKASEGLLGSNQSQNGSVDSKLENIVLNRPLSRNDDELPMLNVSVNNEKQK